jgi:hypothetical protein
MGAPLSRRQFLAGLAALGASLPFPGLTSATEINRSWTALVRSPWEFEVDEYGTIVEPDVKAPSIRNDVYDLDLNFIQSPETLIDEVQSHQELRGHFAGLASNYRDDLVGAIEEHEWAALTLSGTGDDAPSAEERAYAESLLITTGRIQTLQKLAKSLEDEDEGWADWITAEGQAGLPQFLKILQGWLAEPVDWSQMEFWPDGWSSQGKALAFFEQLDGELLDALGVQIIMGEHPGSSYYAAELRAPVDQANDEAQRLKLPFRFRSI